MDKTLYFFAKLTSQKSLDERKLKNKHKKCNVNFGQVSKLQYHFIMFINISIFVSHITFKGI